MIDEVLNGQMHFDHASALLALGSYAEKSNSYYAMRAAILWRERERIKTLLTAQTAMQRIGGMHRSWVTCLNELQLALDSFEAIKSVSREECLQVFGLKPKQIRSKKWMLGRLAANWIEQFLAKSAHSLRYRSAALLMAICGFRPEELSPTRELAKGIEPGVTVRFVSGMVAVTIAGAKVTSKSGQPERSFLLDVNKLPGWFVQEISDGALHRYTADPVSFSRHVTRVSEAVFPRSNPRSAKDILVSPYVFRHALATDLRRSGWDVVEIASALGELVSDTVRHYGLRRGSVSVDPDRSALVRGSVSTSRSVRPLKMPSFDDQIHVTVR